MKFVQYVNQLKIVSVLVGLANEGFLTMETSLAVDSLEEMEMEHQNRIAEEESQLNGSDSVSEEKEGAAQLLGIWEVAAFVGNTISKKSHHILSLEPVF